MHELEQSLPYHDVPFDLNGISQTENVVSESTNGLMLQPLGVSKRIWTGEQVCTTDFCSALLYSKSKRGMHLELCQVCDQKCVFSYSSQIPAAIQRQRRDWQSVRLKVTQLKTDKMQRELISFSLHDLAAKNAVCIEHVSTQCARHTLLHIRGDFIIEMNRVGPILY